MTVDTAIDDKKTKYPVTELLLLLVAVFWGTSYGLTKSALVYTSVLVFIFIRFFVTFLFMLPVVIRDFRHNLNSDWPVAIPTGFILTGIFFCEAFGVYYTSASKAVFLISLSVIMTAFVELLVNKRRVSNQLFSLALISVVGVVCLTSGEQLKLSLNFGDSLILAAAILRAFMVTVTKRVTEGKAITNSTLTSLQSLVVAVAAGVAALLFLPRSQLVLPIVGEFWLVIMYLVIFCTLYSFYVQNYAVRNTSPTRVSLLMGSEPLFGALFGILWLHESLTTLQMFGGLLIFFCVIATSLSKN